MLSRKDLNWSIPKIRLYNEAFTGRAKSIPRCPHCLADDHIGVHCPHNPNPPLFGWVQGATQTHFQTQQLASQKSPTTQEVCRTYNANRCRYSRCRYRHICSDCGAGHPALNCPQRQSTSGRGVVARYRQLPRDRQQPYFTPPSATAAGEPQMPARPL